MRERTADRPDLPSLSRFRLNRPRLIRPPRATRSTHPLLLGPSSSRCSASSSIRAVTSTRPSNHSNSRSGVRAKKVLTEIGAGRESRCRATNGKRARSRSAPGSGSPTEGPHRSNCGRGYSMGIGFPPAAGESSPSGSIRQRIRVLHPAEPGNDDDAWFRFSRDLTSTMLR